MRRRARNSSSIPIVPSAARSSEAAGGNRDDLEFDRPNVELRFLERDEREPGDAVARLGARPVVEGQLEVDEVGDAPAVLGRALRDVAGLVVDDGDPAGRVVAVEPVDIPEKLIAVELDVGGGLAADDRERMGARALEEPCEITLGGPPRAAALQLVLDVRRRNPKR